MRVRTAYDKELQKIQDQMLVMASMVDQAIFRSFGDCLRRADDLASGDPAMHTREREVRQPNSRVGSLFQRDYSSPVDRLVEERMMSFTCHDAGIAGGTAG